jgi:hypothetical protein
VISSYSSPEQLGHRYLENLWDGGPVYAQEKVDGSCGGAAVISSTFHFRSRNQQLDVDAPDKMFALAVQSLRELADKGLLTDGYTYRGEVVTREKHNTLRYGRIPKGGMILFDVDKGNQDYMTPGGELEEEAARIGLECVPLLGVFYQKPSLDELNALIDRESILGGCLIEGAVFKNPRQYDRTGKVLMGKYVRPGFSELNNVDFRQRNPSRSDVVQSVIDTYCTEARWRKAVQHLREEGKIEGVPQDIPLLMREVSEDVLRECGQDIKDKLFDFFWKKEISKGITKSLPDWYKRELVSSQFGE